MSVTVETTSNLGRRITVVLPLQPIMDEVNQRIGQLARTTKLAGFRPGKVPLKIVQQQYGARVRDEVLSSTVERTFTAAIEENKFRVAGFPEIQHKPLEEAVDEFEYTANFEVFPEVTIGALDQIELERPVLELADADIQKTIDVLLRQRATFEPVKRAARKGDRIHIVLSAAIDGEQVENSGDQGIELILGEGGRYPEFDESLLGGKAGTDKTFAISYPAEHKPEQLAGKTVEYTVKFSTVAEPKLPELDAEFARSLGVEDGDLDKMRSEIKVSLGQEVEKRVKVRLKEQVFQALLDHAELELPRALVDIEIQRQMDATRQNLQQRGVDTTNVTLEPTMFEEQAQRATRLRLILGDLVIKNALQAQADQVRAMVDQFGQSFEDPEEVVRWYYADPKRLDEPAALATEENVVDWVLEKAKVSDKQVSFDELMGNV